MRFVTRSECRQRFEGKSVAVVGSGPGVLGNAPGYVDSFDVVLRVNNYKLSPAAGFRTDVHYSFYGNSIRKTADELRRDGVTLCMCKCPNAHAIDSDWHRRRGRMMGVDFRWIYARRAAWWFCDTYVPDVSDFRRGFELLGGHIPTTGFAAILDVLSFGPARVYLTGFDFFASGKHNVDEPWREKNGDDPIRHLPRAEAHWLATHRDDYSITIDAALAKTLATAKSAA
jgi:hypothetical protein